jgi:hypothetical protein
MLHDASDIYAARPMSLLMIYMLPDPCSCQHSPTHVAVSSDMLRSPTDVYIW